MNNPTIYVFANKSLGMSAGKLAAQVGHAVAISLIEDLVIARRSWRAAMHKTILVMEARDETHLLNIKQYLNERNIITHAIIDEGVNEIEAHTITALATCILDKDDENVIKALSTFKLYRDKVRVTIEVDK